MAADEANWPVCFICKVEIILLSTFLMQIPSKIDLHKLCLKIGPVFFCYPAENIALPTHTWGEVSYPCWSSPTKWFSAASRVTHCGSIKLHLLLLRRLCLFLLLLFIFFSFFFFGQHQDPLIYYDNLRMQMCERQSKSTIYPIQKADLIQMKIFSFHLMNHFT